MLKRIAIVLAAALALLLVDAFLVRAEAKGTAKQIVPPKPLWIENVFCRSLVQIKEVARLILVGNSPEAAMSQINMDWRIGLCEYRKREVWDPKLKRLFSTDFHEVAIYEVRTHLGVRYIFLQRRRIKV